MFENKKLGITIPQQEHARFAGVFAYYWGNANFDTPTYGNEALTKGVAFHHMGYGVNDTIDFRNLSNQELINVFKRDVNVDLHNIDAELVNLFHHLRLINNQIGRSKSTAFNAVKKSVEGMIRTKLDASKYEKSDFENGNPIAHTSDRISFEFCLGQVVEPEIPVYKGRNSSELVVVKHTIDDHGIIQVDPWPFSVSNFEGFIIGYDSNNYPKKLIPQLLRYKVTPIK